MVKKFIYFGLIAAVLCSCSYSVYSNAYPHLKKVAIRPFENRSTEFEIGDIIYNELVNQFQEDGRLKLVTQQPDCVIEGTILKWEESVFQLKLQL